MARASEEPEKPDDAREDSAATERPADAPPGSEHSDSEEGGPYGNPRTDEESLRKHQEESERSSDG